MAIAYIQEFEIRNGDTSTTNYDKISGELDLADKPEGLLLHTAGFDHGAGVFRIFDVWTSREHGERFITDRLNPIIEPLAAAAMASADGSFDPPSREGWYELHDTIGG